jgi:hypothetical protein
MAVRWIESNTHRTALVARASDCPGAQCSRDTEPCPEAETQLRVGAQASAIPYVDVVSPKGNADADEIALPGKDRDTRSAEVDDLGRLGGGREKPQNEAGESDHLRVGSVHVAPG